MLEITCHHPDNAIYSTNVDANGSEIHIVCGECGGNVTVRGSSILTARDLHVWASVTGGRKIPDQSVPDGSGVDSTPPSIEYRHPERR